MVLPRVCAVIRSLSNWWSGKGRLKLEIMVSDDLLLPLVYF
nr:MAG TPA: hypothetical protein [Caudoviricetes sp.]